MDMRAPTTTTCEVVGGPRDGDLIVVPGTEPPERLRVILPADNSHLYVWHPAAPGLPELHNAFLVVLEREHRPDHPAWAWCYLWPQGG